MNKISLSACMLVLISLGMHFTGCAGGRAMKASPNAQPEILIPQIALHNARIKSFTGRAVMTVQTEGERPFRVTMTLAMNRPDSLWFKMEGLLGLNMALGRFGGQQGQVYVPFENQVYEGDIHRLQSLNILPIDLPLTDLMMGLIGLPVPELPVSDSLMTLAVEQNCYRLNSPYGEEIIVDPVGPVVKRWEKRDAFGEPQWLWEGESFYKMRGIWLPKVIRMSQNYPKQRITLIYEAMKPNASLKSNWFDIKIPEGVEIVRL